MSQVTIFKDAGISCMVVDNLPNTAPPIVSVIPSRTSGVAPLVVFFDATGTTDADTLTPFHDLDYRWDFGDPASGKWGAGVEGLSRNRATGPMAAHCYEIPGTYAWSVKVSDGAHTVAQSGSITVTSISDANTICIAAASLPVAGADGVPVGAICVQQPNFVMAINTHATTGKKILFKRGDTFTAPNVNTTPARIAVTGPGIVGAYGTGAEPVIQGTSSDTVNDAPILKMSSPTTPGIVDWRIMDLNFDGAASPNKRVVGVWCDGGINQLTLFRLKGNSLRLLVEFSASLLTIWNNDPNPIRHGHTIWDQLSVLDSIVRDVNYAPPGGSTQLWGYSTFLSGERVFYAGNDMDNAGTAVLGVSHVARFPYLGKAVISNNTLERAGPSEHLIKLHAPKQGLSNVETAGIGGGFTRWVIISDNQFTGAYNAWPVAVGPGDSSSDERVKDVIIERNAHTAGPGTQFAIKVWAQNVTVRNNLMDLTGALAHCGVGVGRRGIEPFPDGVWVYNNMACSEDADNDFAIADFATGVTNCVAANNLGYASKDTKHAGITCAGSSTLAACTGLTAMNNATAAQVGGTDPQFAHWRVNLSQGRVGL